MNWMGSAHPMFNRSPMSLLAQKRPPKRGTAFHLIGFSLSVFTSLRLDASPSAENGLSMPQETSLFWHETRRGVKCIRVVK
jgi:hypothetical protein